MSISTLRRSPSKTKLTTVRSQKKSDLLARAFLQILTKEVGVRSRLPGAGASNRDDPVEGLLDDVVENRSDERSSIRPDLAAVAVLTARAIEKEEGLLLALRRGAPVVVIATHNSELVEMVEKIVENCALASSGSGQARNEFKLSRSPGERGLIVARKGGDKDEKPETGNKTVAAALHAQLPVIGIAADPKRHLPKDLMRAAEYHLSLPQLDQSALDLVIEAVTGKRPTRTMEADLLKRLDISDLALAIRPNRSAGECFSQLEKLVATKAGNHSSGPRLRDFEGFGEAKTWGLELSADLAEYKAGRLSWDDVDHKGVLIAGPPGVGKTMFAKALSGEAQVPLVATSVAEWNAASYLSGTLQAMRNAFDRARLLAPCILFIDEIDGISDRSKLDGQHVEYWSQVVNQLLELLAGIEERSGVVVVGATNYPQRIDPAVKRAGRLDREIWIDRPDAAALAKIFRHHVGNMLPGEDLMPVAAAAVGATGADVEAWVRRAKGKARRQRRVLHLDDLMTEVNSRRAPVGSTGRRLVAVHEAGHAVIGNLLGFGPVLGVSLTNVGGVTELADGLKGCWDANTCERMLIALLAGRAAEALLLGKASIGAGIGIGSDLAQATEIARRMETDYGLGVLGPIYLGDDVGARMNLYPGLLDSVRKRLEVAQQRAETLVRENRAAVEAVATALEKQGYLSGADIARLMEPPVALAKAG